MSEWWDPNLLLNSDLQPVVSERQTAQCVFTQTKQSPLLLQTAVDSTNSHVWQKSYTAVNTLCVFTGLFLVYWLRENTRNRHPSSTLLHSVSVKTSFKWEGWSKTHQDTLFILKVCLSVNSCLFIRITNLQLQRNISLPAQYSWRVSIWTWIQYYKLHLHSVFEQSFSPVEVFQTHPALRHSHSPSVCIRCSPAPSPCSSLIRTRGSTSPCCCDSSWATDRKWVRSTAGWSKSSPNPPRRDSPWRMPTVSHVFIFYLRAALGIVWLFKKYTYLHSCWELDEHW